MQHHPKFEFPRSAFPASAPWLSPATMGKWLMLALLCTSGCIGSARSPWDLGNTKIQHERSDVETLNTEYQRVRSTVLVRRIKKPTRAALDFAAYSKNFMIADPAPEQTLDFSAAPDTSRPFKGLIDAASLTGDVSKVPLSNEEWDNAFAFSPAVEHLANRQVKGAELLQEVNTSVRDEWWGFSRLPGFAPQSVSDVYVHKQGESSELWAKIEFAP
jgi:hypothetical protein